MCILKNKHFMISNVQDFNFGKSLRRYFQTQSNKNNLHTSNFTVFYNSQTSIWKELKFEITSAGHVAIWMTISISLFQILKFQNFNFWNARVLTQEITIIKNSVCKEKKQTCKHWTNCTQHVDILKFKTFDMCPSMFVRLSIYKAFYIYIYVHCWNPQVIKLLDLVLLHFQFIAF